MLESYDHVKPCKDRPKIRFAPYLAKYIEFGLMLGMVGKNTKSTCDLHPGT